jgi:hypothetical protein
MTKSFYQKLYETDGTSNMDAMLNTVPCKVTDDMNAKLLTIYTEKEVKTARFQMFPTKAPGPNGLPAHFTRSIGICAVLRLHQQC